MMALYGQLQLLVIVVLSIISSLANALSVEGRATSPSVAGTILIFSTDTTSAYSVTSGFNGYGIPTQLVIVPQAGITLPQLNASTTQGNYGGIVILSDVAYSYSTGWASALNASQWQQLYSYQTSFNVRMVRINVYPGPDFGTTTQIAGAGCCNAGVEQYVYISNSSAFPTANLKTGPSANMSTQGLWHYPATITNTSTTKEIAQFAASSDGTFTSTSTAAVINNFGGRMQMAWFTSWATNWSPTSTLLQHAYIHWVTRGLFVGRRRVYFSTQIDDMFLETDLYLPSGTTYKISTADLALYPAWMKSVNSRLPSGSNYTVEIGHNGNGNVETATDNDSNNYCTPQNAIEYADQVDTALEFQKPLGSGANIWPKSPLNYTWSKNCLTEDPLGVWWQNTANLNSFMHISHTFTHEDEDNATFSDVYKEIQFNVKWMQQSGIASATRFSGKGLIPPAITGLHNGDAINAWMQNGITQVVGDNTRAPLVNTQNEFWPLISTVAANGYAGLTIMPRWATTIFYNCNTPNCTLQEWINTSAGAGDFNALLLNAKQVNTWHLFALRQDPFMFHQANLRNADMPTVTIGTQTGKMGIHMMWVETIIQEMIRLVTWPFISLKHDDVAQMFINRMAQDACTPNFTYNLNSAGTSITSIIVSTNGNTCPVPIPVTIPSGTITTSASTVKEQIGSDAPMYWVQMNGSPVTLTLSVPVSVP